MSKINRNQIAITETADSSENNLYIIALYIGLFPGLYAALRKVNLTWTAFATAIVMIGVTTSFATHSGFSMLHLNDRYAAAVTEAERSQLRAAGEAVIAANLWNSSGGYMAGILLQGAGVLISAIMLGSKDFSRVTAYSGILGNGFDLVQHILHPFAPSVSTTLLMLAGPFYLIWFPMLARDLFRLGWVGHLKGKLLPQQL